MYSYNVNTTMEQMKLPDPSKLPEMIELSNSILDDAKISVKNMQDLVKFYIFLCECYFFL